MIGKREYWQPQKDMGYWHMGLKTRLCTPHLLHYTGIALKRLGHTLGTRGSKVVFRSLSQLRRSRMNSGCPCFVFCPHFEVTLKRWFVLYSISHFLTIATVTAQDNIIRQMGGGQPYDALHRQTVRATTVKDLQNNPTIIAAIFLNLP